MGSRFTSPEIFILRYSSRTLFGSPTEMELMERSIFWSFELRERRVAFFFQGIQCEWEREREREKDPRYAAAIQIRSIGSERERTNANRQASELIGMSTAESNARTDAKHWRGASTNIEWNCHEFSKIALLSALKLPSDRAWPLENVRKISLILKNHTLNISTATYCLR